MFSHFWSQKPHSSHSLRSESWKHWKEAGSIVDVRFFAVTLSSLVEPLEKVTAASICGKQEHLTLTSKINRKSKTHRYRICCHWPPSSPWGRHRCRPPASSCSRGHSRDLRTDCSLKILSGVNEFSSRVCEMSKVGDIKNHKNIVSKQAIPLLNG